MRYFIWGSAVLFIQMGLSSGLFPEFTDNVNLFLLLVPAFLYALIGFLAFKDHYRLVGTILFLLAGMSGCYGLLLLMLMSAWTG